jgi:hypothetical protein
MDPKVIISLIAAGVAVVSAVISIAGQIRLAKFNAALEQEKETREKQRKAEEILSRYRDPLAHAAYELQSKLFNILRQGLLQVYYVNGNESEREYTVQNTIFVISQFLCWREIIRREIQYLDLGEVESTRKLTELMEEIQMLLLTDGFGRVFRIFRGEQRAIGEKMITCDSEKHGCMGYARFVEQQDDTFRRWFHQLENDVVTLSKDLSHNAERLVHLQHALIDLINYLDPRCIRFQEKYRQKV